MRHLLKIKCVDSRVNVHILVSTSITFTLTTVQVLNLALTYTKWITVWGIKNHGVLQAPEIVKTASLIVVWTLTSAVRCYWENYDKWIIKIVQLSLHRLKLEGFKSAQSLHRFKIKGFKATQSLHRFEKRVLKRHNRFIASKRRIFKWRRRFIAQKDGL
jgi:hypothetical protein